MATLANYPNLSQLAARENGPFDCVPTSILDGLEYLTGRTFGVDAMMDEVYGPGYQGFTSASAFVQFCAAQGVRLAKIDGDPAQLVADLHAQIEAGHPCLLTEPDPYAPLHPDWSHVLSVYGEAPGSLTARDPFSTRDVTHSDAEWAKLLEFREIWTLSPISTPGLPQGWHDDGHTLTAPNGVKVVLGFREFVLKNAWHPENWPLVGEQGLTPLEESNPSLGSGTQQVFRWTVLEWTPARGVFVAWVGQEFLYLREARRKLYNFYKSVTSTPIG